MAAAVKVMEVSEIIVNIKKYEPSKFMDLPLPIFALDFIQKKHLWPIIHVQDEERTQDVLAYSPESPVPKADDDDDDDDDRSTDVLDRSLDVLAIY